MHDPREIYVDFDDSCDLDGLTGMVMNDKGRRDLERLRRLYSENFRGPVAEKPKIPQVLHQIWIGKGKMPQRYRQYRRNWRTHHPEWEYCLWTDDEIAAGEWETQDLLDTAEGIGEKADILRAEILYRHGGLYVDTDYDFFRALDVFHHLCDFYTTLRPVPTTFILSGCPDDVYPLGICNSLIGSVPRHPILERYLQLVREQWQKGQYRLSRRERWSIARLLLGKEKFRLLCQTLTRTYFPFERAFLEVAGTTESCDLALPPTYFNPIDAYRKYRFYSIRYYWYYLQYRIGGGTRPVPPFSRIEPCAFTHHESQMAWL